MGIMLDKVQHADSHTCSMSSSRTDTALELFCAMFESMQHHQAECRPTLWMQDGRSWHEHRDSDSPATLQCVLAVS